MGRDGGAPLQAGGKRAKESSVSLATSSYSKRQEKIELALSARARRELAACIYICIPRRRRSQTKDICSLALALNLATTKLTLAKPALPEPDPASTGFPSLELSKLEAMQSERIAISELVHVQRQSLAG